MAANDGGTPACSGDKVIRYLLEFLGFTLLGSFLAEIIIMSKDVSRRRRAPGPPRIRVRFVHPDSEEGLRMRRAMIAIMNGTRPDEADLTYGEPHVDADIEAMLKKTERRMERNG